MKAIAVDKYGDIDNLKAITASDPGKAKGHDILVRVKACSVNPVDTKVRAGTYDDYPDFYDHTPPLPHIIGFDGAGVVEAVGDQSDPASSNAEYQLVDSRAVAHKPKSLSMVQAAAMPLTWITAYEALVERMGIQRGEKAGVLIVNGSGGVGSVASQIARTVLELPVVVTTTSRKETSEFSKSMGATHTVNHREEDLPGQIKKLNLEVPIKYIFITHTPTSKYIVDSAKICAPFGKVCSIVQDKEIPMYGTAFMAKSLTFVWALLGTKPYYGVNFESHGTILNELAGLLDKGNIKCHLTKTLPLNAEGVREGHKMIEKGGVMGKVGLGVDAEGLKEEDAFA